METELVTIRFFKPNGRFYTGCVAELPIWLSDPEYKQAIVDKQVSLEDGWQDSDSAWIVVTSAANPEEHKGFHEHVFIPFSFKGITKSSDFRGAF